jgi:hypothetical protein
MGWFEEQVFERRTGMSYDEAGGRDDSLIQERDDAAIRKLMTPTEREPIRLLEEATEGWMAIAGLAQRAIRVGLLSRSRAAHPGFPSHGTHRTSDERIALNRPRWVSYSPYLSSLDRPYKIISGEVPA